MAISLTKSNSGTWVDETELHLKLPPKVSSENSEELVVPFGSATVFVGPNGAGKSRMAGWIDRNNSDVIYIRARRSIVMPNSYSITPEEDEFMNIIAGHRLQNTDTMTAKNFRYSPTRDGFGDDDFHSVLNILGSKHTTSALKFRNTYQFESPPEVVPSSELDEAIYIWNQVLPHLSIDATQAPKLTILRASDPQVKFEPKEMSDGEKAIFYLVGKCMIAPPGSTILVDEPEMYVHRSVRGRLWNSIEKARQDCAFVYFTHDLNFVRTRQYASVFHIRSYENDGKGRWEYARFVSDPEADESLQISVWGSRQSTLLIEGDRNSLDFKILSLTYPGIAIEPAGSCSQVIDGVAALRKQKRFHHQNVYGFIDADFRDTAECSTLSRKGVHCLQFREIENLLVCREVVEKFAKHFGFSDNEISTKCTEITNLLQLKAQAKFVTVGRELYKRKILNTIESRVSNDQEIKDVSEIITNDEIEKYKEESKIKVSSSASGDLNSILSVFSVRKDDIGQVFSRAFDLKDFRTYTDVILRLASDKNDPAGILKVIKKKLPSLS